MNRQYISLLLGSSTCIQQSANDGYFRNKDCWQLNNFVCEINANAEFSEPPEGKLWFVFIHEKKYIFRELHSHPKLSKQLSEQLRPGMRYWQYLIFV